MKIHMPSFDALNCCAGVSKWCCRNEGCACTWSPWPASLGKVSLTLAMMTSFSPSSSLVRGLGARLRGNRFLGDLVPTRRELFGRGKVIVVRSAGDDRRLPEVRERHGRLGHPLVACRAPRVPRRALALPEGLEQRVRGREEAHCEDPRAD